MEEQHLAPEICPARCKTARNELTDLEAMIWALPPLLREALILVGAQELTYEEAALVCDVPVGTIKARVSRGRAALARSDAPCGGWGDLT